VGRICGSFDERGMQGSRVRAWGLAAGSGDKVAGDYIKAYRGQHGGGPSEPQRERKA